MPGFQHLSAFGDITSQQHRMSWSVSATLLSRGTFDQLLQPFILPKLLEIQHYSNINLLALLQYLCCTS